MACRGIISHLDLPSISLDLPHVCAFARENGTELWEADDAHGGPTVERMVVEASEVVGPWNAPEPKPKGKRKRKGRGKGSGDTHAEQPPPPQP